MSGSKSINRNRLRIIAGKWRGRKLQFPDVDGLRPTADRIRETLFNWLQPVIAGSRCLDLFAGSGALGLEALSRGAAQVTMVDRDIRVIRQLEKQVKALSAQGADCLCADGIEFLLKSDHSYDIVFLDPPFQANLLPACIRILQQNNCLKPGSRVYIEHDRREMLPDIPANWQSSRSKRAGQVGYHLFMVL